MVEAPVVVPGVRSGEAAQPVPEVHQHQGVVVLAPGSQEPRGADVVCGEKRRRAFPILGSAALVLILLALYPSIVDMLSNLDIQIGDQPQWDRHQQLPKDPSMQAR